MKCFYRTFIGCRVRSFKWLCAITFDIDGPSTPAPQCPATTTQIHCYCPFLNAPHCKPVVFNRLPRARQQTRAYGPLLHPTDNKYVVLGHPMNQIKPKAAHLRASILVHAPFRPKTTHLLAHAGLTPGRPPLAPSTRFPSSRERIISTSAYP